MSEFDLLTTVQPTEGWFAVLGIKGKGDVRQKLVATREEVDQLATDYMAQGRNVFFGVAKYETDEGRTKDNVKAIKAFWLDIDCGESKAEVNEKTGRPSGYLDQATGLQELKRFYKLVGVPKPVLVNSGRGLHVYWPLTEAVTREQWEPVADRLRELCNIHELYVDPAVFEVARVLRIPGTLNFKDDPATEVTIIGQAEPVDFEAFRSLLGVKEKPVAPPKRELSELAKSMMDNTISVFGKIMRRSLKGEGCKQLADSYQNRATLDYNRWFDALSIAQRCSDRDTAIHKLSEGHPGYDFAATEAKANEAGGPHFCTTFERNNPGGCEGCPFKGKIKSPIVLGKEVLEATEKDNVVTEEPEEEGAASTVHRIPKYPSSYSRGKNGGVYYMPPDDEGELQVIYPDDLYVVKRMVDPVEGDVVVMKLHMPCDGVREFVVSNNIVTKKEELRGILASRGVMCGAKQFNRVIDYVIAAVSEIRYKGKAEQMRLQFGWADRDSKFIIGDREIGIEGTYHSPPSSVTRNIAAHMTPTGSLEKWKEVFALYGRPGLEPNAFAALSAFGSPLLKFLGQSGVIINLINSSSGTGKTTALHMCNSVYGHPKMLCAVKADTLNAKVMRLGVMNTLPFAADEMTNTEPKDFSELAYCMSQGRGKDRVKQSANELRTNLTSWNCISVCSSNASFYEKLLTLKNSPDGEMMRLMEYRIDYSDAIDTAIAKEMFDHQLMENYGHAGDIYANWLVNNLEEAKASALATQAKIDRELKLTQRERIWSAALAANLTGGRIAVKLGLIDWDMKAIYKWATDKLKDIRGDVTPPVTNVVSSIAEFLNRHVQNYISVKDEADGRSGFENSPSQEPRSELMIRVEPDTKKMYIAVKPFKADCVKYQINYKDTLKELKDKGILVGMENKRLSKGMQLVTPPTYCMVLNTIHGEFLNVESFTQAHTPDAGGEG